MDLAGAGAATGSAGPGFRRWARGALAATIIYRCRPRLTGGYHIFRSRACRAGVRSGVARALDVIVLLSFVACGISRLARFNATAKALSDEAGRVQYFEGTSIPTSVLIVLLLGGCTLGEDSARTSG